ncbi:hypothetical protein [Spirosoma agri]
MSVLVLIGLREYPVAATVLASSILCGYCAWTLAEPMAKLVFIYPLFCFWLSQQFTVYDFFEIGDGPAYFAVMDDILPRLTTYDYRGLLALMALAGPKYLNLGFLPTAFLPNLFFDAPGSVVYQLTQVYTHVALVGLLLSLTVKWDVIGERYRCPIFLFMLVSPGYLALVSYPTRHHVTAFAIFLLFISVEACLQKQTVSRLLALFVAVGLIFFCKAGLLPFFVLYLIVRLHNPERRLVNVLLGGVLIGAMIYTYQYVRQLYDARFATETIGVFKDASLGPLMPIYKYVMAIVSPFPYYKYSVVVNTIAYGGNWLLLLLFVPAGMTGLWLFLRVLLNPLKLWRHDEDTKRLFAYGGIMSLSILGGSTGFLMYILVFMPFFAPLFRISDYNVQPVTVLAALLLLNVVVLVLNGENLFDYL